MPNRHNPLPAPFDAGIQHHWWRRVGSPRWGFRFVNPWGMPVTELAARERIRHLAIPPAWKNVHVAPSPRCRVQAMGVDAAGRVQYLYHPAFVARQERKKFEKIEHFGEYLPQLRKVTSEHILQPTLTKERVLATITRLINSLYFRVGSEAGVRRYHTYGVTTLRAHHLRITDDGQLVFTFHGKHHIRHRRILVDEAVAKTIQELKALEGSRLFKYVGADGEPHMIRPQDVNEYIKALTKPEFSAKDFRTWAGTLLVAQELAQLGKASTKTEMKQKLATAVRVAAERLGNTPAVCRRSYLHPAVVRLYSMGLTLEDVPASSDRIAGIQIGYEPQEMAILDLFLAGRQLEDYARRRRSRPKPLDASAPSTAVVPATPDAGAASAGFGA